MFDINFTLAGNDQYKLKTNMKRLWLIDIEAGVVIFNITTKVYDDFNGNAIKFWNKRIKPILKRYDHNIDFYYTKSLNKIFKNKIIK